MFTACSNSKDNDADTSTSSLTTSAIATEEAKIKEGDAVKFIEKSYSAKELGLDKVDKDYSFMVSSSGVDIDGAKYVKVVANVIVKNDVTTDEGKDTFSMETMGEYYISFDGTKVLMKNMETDEYTELENRYDSYKEKESTTTEHSHEETTK